MISMKNVKNIVMLFLVISIALNIGLYKKLDSTYSQYETCKKCISPTYDYLNSITIRNFEDAIKQGEKLVVYIGRPDCSDCIFFEPILRQVVNEYNLFNEIQYLDVKSFRENNSQETWEIFKKKYGFTQTPACIIYENGTYVTQVEWDTSYGLTKQRFMKWLKNNNMI